MSSPITDQIDTTHKRQRGIENLNDIFENEKENNNNSGGRQSKKIKSKK